MPREACGGRAGRALDAESDHANAPMLCQEARHAGDAVFDVQPVRLVPRVLSPVRIEALRVVHLG
jgi:hypothetical protein